MFNVMLNIAGDMTPEGGEESKVGDRSAGENIVTMVTMEQDLEEVSEDNAAEAQDYFKEGYSSELAQVISSCLYHKSNYNYTITGWGLSGWKPRFFQGLPHKEGLSSHDWQLAGGPQSAPRPLPPNITQVWLIIPPHQVG